MDLSFIEQQKATNLEKFETLLIMGKVPEALEFSKRFNEKEIIKAKKILEKRSKNGKERLV